MALSAFYPERTFGYATNDDYTHGVEYDWVYVLCFELLHKAIGCWSGIALIFDCGR